MPKPIPPPPPLPSPAETKAGLRFLFVTMMVGMVFFGVWTLLYRGDSALLDYGRNSSISWVVWKAENLDEKQYRPQPETKVIWLLGSSILRESFDEKEINRRLEAKKIPIRVVKFGINRGASGVVFALLRKLPIREGDIVLHSLSPGNFRKDWMKAVKLPAYRLMSLYEPQDFWDLGEWSLADKLEQSVAYPRYYWRNHEDGTNAFTALWFDITEQTIPEKKRPRFYLRYHRFKKKKKSKMKYGSEHFDSFPPEDNDRSPQQTNIIGLKKMRKIVSEKKATLKLVDIGASQIYMEDVLNDDLVIWWKEWKEQNQVWSIPAMPLSEYYDLKHPNYKGRERLNEQLFLWIINEHS